MKIRNLILFIDRTLLLAFALIGALLLVGFITPSGPLADATQRERQTIRCDSNRAQVVKVGAKSITTLSFPVKPKDIVPGENSFDFHRIGSDLIVKPLRSTANTNVLVYMAERRCAFQFKTVPGPGDGILTVEDPEDKLFEARFK